MSDKLNKLYNDLDKECNDYNISGWHRYGPIDPEKYFNSKYKILFINSESVGFDGSGAVQADEVLNWLDYNTPRNCALMNYVLLYYLESYKNDNCFPKFNYEFFKRTRADIDLLKIKFIYSAYMNTRISSNDTGNFNEDINSVNKEIKMFENYRKNLISILSPTLIIIGGKQAKNAISNLYNLQNLDYNSVIKISNTILLILKHTSRISFLGGYAGIHKILVEVASTIINNE